MRAESIESRRLDAGNLGGRRADHHAMLPSSFKFDQDNDGPDDRLVDEDDEDDEDDKDDEDDEDDKDDEDDEDDEDDSTATAAAAASSSLNEADSAGRDNDDGKSGEEEDDVDGIGGSGGWSKVLPDPDGDAAAAADNVADTVIVRPS